MMMPSVTRLTATIGGLALSLAVAPGIVSADPADGSTDPGQLIDNYTLINTPCTYAQLVFALKNKDTSKYNSFMAQPNLQNFLDGYIESAPDERQQILNSVLFTPQATPFLSIMVPVLATCNNTPPDVAANQVPPPQLPSD
jgi:hypothetical protein